MSDILKIFHLTVGHKGSLEKVGETCRRKVSIARTDNKEPGNICY